MYYKIKKIIKYFFISIALYIILLSNAFCLFGPSLKLFNKTIANLTSQIKAVVNTTIQLKSQVQAIMKVQANIQAKITGWDQSINNTVSSGRDSTTITNDTRLLIFAMSGYITAFALCFVIIIFQLMSSRKRNKAFNRQFGKLIESMINAEIKRKR